MTETTDTATLWADWVVGYLAVAETTHSEKVWAHRVVVSSLALEADVDRNSQEETPGD